MSDKNLQASIELQVSTPGSEKLAQLKKDVKELMSSLTGAGTAISANLEKATLAAVKASAATQKAKDSDYAKAQDHERKLQVLDKQREVEAAKSAGKQAEQRIKADAQVERSATNLAAVNLQIAAQAKAANDAVTESRLQNLKRIEQAEANLASRRLAQEAAWKRQSETFQNAGRVQNPNAAFSLGSKENVARDVAAAEASALLQANSFGGKFKSTMGGWAKSSSEAFTSSFGSGMLGGMGKVMAAVGAMFAGKAFIKDNIADTNVYYGLLAANKNNAVAAHSEKADLYKMANDHGADYLKTGDKVMGVYSAAKATGMDNSEVKRMLSGFMDLFQARHIDDAHQNKALIAIAEMLSTDKLGRKEAIRQLGINDIHGLAPVIKQFIISESGGLLKSNGDVDKALAGKKQSNGKTYEIDPETFAKRFADYLHIQYGATAREATLNSPQSAIARFNNSIHDLNLTLGESGVIDVFTHALNGMTTTLHDPSVVANVKEFGKWVKQTAEDLQPAIRGMMDFVKEHKTGLKYLGEFVLGLIAFNLALKLIIGPFIGLAKIMTEAAGAFTFFGEKALAFGRLLGIAGPAAVEGATIATTAEVATFGVALAAGFKNVLAMVLTGIRGALPAIGAAVMAWQELKPGVDAHQAQLALAHKVNEGDQNNKGLGVRALSDNEIQQGLDSTLKARRGSWGNREVELKAFQDKLENERTRRIKADGQTKAENRNENERLANRSAAAQSDATRPSKPLIRVGDDKTKGRSAHAQDSELASAIRFAADSAAAADSKERKAKLAADEENLNVLLEKQLISYEAFYKEKAVLANKSAADEEKDLQQKAAGDIAAIRVGMLEHPRDSVESKAGAIRIEAIRLNLAKELNAVEDKRLTTQSKITESADKEADTFKKKMADVKGQLDKEMGRIDIHGQDSKIAEDHAKDRREAFKNGGQDAADQVDQLVKVLQEKAQLAAVDEKIAITAQHYANQEAELGLRVEQGLTTKHEAENQILALKKEQAATSLEMLEGELKIAQNDLVREQIQKRIIADKVILNEKTAEQKALEAGVLSTLQSTLDAMMNGTKRLVGGLKDLAKGVMTIISKTMSTNLAETGMQYLKGQGGEGKDGGFDVLGKLGSILGFDSLGKKDQKIGTMHVDSLVVAGGLGGDSGTKGGGGFLDSIIGAGKNLFSGSDGFLGGLTDSAGGSGASLAGLNGLGSAVVGLASGGAVRGDGTSTSDSIMARLSHGEYVIPANLVKRMGGIDMLDKMRMGMVPAFADGGLVSASARATAPAPSSSRSGMGMGGGVTINVTTPDANSFRASQPQIMAEMALASQMARMRSGA